MVPKLKRFKGLTITSDNSTIHCTGTPDFIEEKKKYALQELEQMPDGYYIMFNGERLEKQK